MNTPHPLSRLTEPTDRVARLREHALRTAHDPAAWSGDEADLAEGQAWLASAGEPSYIVRRGMLAGGILRRLEPAIGEDELIVGKYARRALDADEAAFTAQWRDMGRKSAPQAQGQRAHMAIDYERVLQEGISGVREIIARQRRGLRLTDPTDLARECFYRGALEALSGMEELSGRYADRAEAMAADEPDPVRAAELEAIAERCRRVPARPARTFAEAVQAVSFVTFCQCAGNRMLLFQLGRPDRYLLPYYLRDLGLGRITPDEAQELLDCAGLILSEYTPRGLAVGWMCGGRDSSGSDVTNDLTYMMVQCAWHIRLPYPGIGICRTSDTPDDLMEMACGALARGCSHPAVFGDETITRGLLRAGLPHRDACQYVHSTCVEITPVAISNVYVASPYYNLGQALNDVLGVPRPGREAAAPCRCTGFEELFERLKEAIAAEVEVGVRDQNLAMMSRHLSGGYPLLSCFVNDCLLTGRDIDHGGARANWVESSFVGLANTVDALAAIRQVVYQHGAVTTAELRDALAADFEGHDRVRALLASAPKYGNDIAEVDTLADELTRFLHDVCSRYRTYWGGAVIAGFFCWVMHEHLGRHTGATADGRAAGYPFADGSGPAQGRERSGPTAMVRSSTSWSHCDMLGGIAVNMRFQRTGDPDALAAAMKPLIGAFCSMGGFEAQVNVVSPDVLRDAVAHPERHRDLVVRIAGYSDYFVGLSPQMQAEVMARTELECD